MDDLISRKELLMNVVAVSNYKGQVTWSAVSTTDIIAAPSVDAVEVVRCKNCDWYRDEERICVNPHCTKSYYGCRVREDHYCSYGERKEKGDGHRKAKR